jgi:hypothetical protein
MGGKRNIGSCPSLRHPLDAKPGLILIFFAGRGAQKSEQSAMCEAVMTQSVLVTADNFTRAETDTYFAGFVKQGAFGRFKHNRELVDVEHQDVVRPNSRHALLRSACSISTRVR